MEPIAELRLQLLRRGAKRKVTVHIAIGAPQPAGARDWFCSVRLTGIDGKERKIFGVDSWQALTLAFKIVQVILRHEVRDGGQFYRWGHEVSVGSLFSNRIRP